MARKGVSVLGKKLTFVVVAIGALVLVLLALLARPSAVELAVAGLLVAVALAFAAYVGTWLRNELAWRGERQPEPQPAERPLEVVEPSGSELADVAHV
jgi:hypothetical protein